jgi:hypothetical protein
MKPKQAKDFLIQQITEQADRENMPLSDIEKKMMYFTESDATSCDNPVELNEEFEAQNDTATYEVKISRLLHHARLRLKEEDPERMRDWDQSIRTLRKGDHYILVLWDLNPSGERPAGDSLKLLGSAVLIATGVLVTGFLAAKYNLNLEGFRKRLPAPSPQLAIVFYIGLVLLALGAFRLFNWGLVAWLERRARKDKDLG